jgi:hypothetical protein
VMGELDPVHGSDLVASKYRGRTGFPIRIIRRGAFHGPLRFDDLLLFGYCLVVGRLSALSGDQIFQSLPVLCSRLRRTRPL